MESSGSGAFSQGDLGGEDDPFAGSEEDFGMSVQEREAAQRAADEHVEAENAGGAVATEALPVVDREGEPVQPAPEEPAAPDATQIAAEQEAAAVAEQADPFGATADGSPAEAQGAGVDPSDAATAGEPPAAAEAAGEPGGTEAAAPTSASSGAPGEAAGAESEDKAAAGASAEPTDGAEADTADPPQEKKGGTKRQYKLFTPEGSGKFSEVVWHEDKAGKVVPKGAPGAKKQTIVLARGQEDALHHGYSVMGKPADGVSLVAVAATYWQVRHVQPDEVQPVRQRLKIS